MFCLDTDASGYGIGAVLSQEQDGRESVIAYASKTLKNTERNYCVTRRELLAVVTFVKHFRPYLYGRKFIVRTDHGSLRWLLNFQNPEGQVARWIQVLGEYDYQVVHRPGKGRGNADGLSRKPYKQYNLIDGEQPIRMRGAERKLRRKNLSVHWKAGSDLVEIRTFECDPEERIDVCKIRDYFSESRAESRMKKAAESRHCNASERADSELSKSTPDHADNPAEQALRLKSHHMLDPGDHTLPVQKPDHSSLRLEGDTAERRSTNKADQTVTRTLDLLNSLQDYTFRQDDSKKSSDAIPDPIQSQNTGSTKTATRRSYQRSKISDRSFSRSSPTEAVMLCGHFATPNQSVNPSDRTLRKNKRSPSRVKERPHNKQDHQSKRVYEHQRNFARYVRTSTSWNNRQSPRNNNMRLVTMNSLWSVQEMKVAQESDPDLNLIMKAKRRNLPRPAWKAVSPLSKAAKCYWAQWDRLELKNGMLHSRWESDDGRSVKWQLVIPEEYKEKILKELRSSRTAGHLGVTKTREKVKERFYWVAFNKDVRSWIRKCDVCPRRKSPSTRSRAKLKQEVAGHRGRYGYSWTSPRNASRKPLCISSGGLFH